MDTEKTEKTNPIEISTKPLAQSQLPEILEAPDLSQYMDFRRFLNDFFLFKRKSTEKDLRPYSFAMFSAAADIKSPNYLKMIIEGKRNLSPEMISKFAKAMGLLKDQADEFRLLVLYGQSTEPAKRNMYLKSLNEYRVKSQLKSGAIDQKTWDKIPSWIAWVLYSMIDMEGVSFKVQHLREILRNKASEHEIQEAIESLVQAGEVTMDPVTGELKKARNLMDSADDVPVALVRKLQAQLMYLGLESLFLDAPTEREFGAATLSLTKSEFEDLKFKLRQLRKAAQKDISVKRMNSKGERVYQLNIQLFPVTK